MKQATNTKNISPLTIAVITLAIVGTIADIFRRAYFGGGCLLKDIFNTPCPSCGMSRAYFSVLMLDFEKAFAFHPLFWIFPTAVGIGIAATFDKKRRKLWLSLLGLCIVAYFICWIIRLATGNTV